MMGEDYCRRVDATVRGVPCDLFVITHFLVEGEDVESGGLRVEATDGQDYWRTGGALRAQDLSQTLTSGRMRAAVEALAAKFPPSRDFEYALDAKDVLNVRFKAGKTMNRLRVALAPNPAPAAAVLAALTGLAANVRRLRAGVGALAQQEAALRLLAEWARETRASVELDGLEARERACEGVAALLTEKARELRVAAGMPEEPEEEADEAWSAGEEEDDLLPRTSAEAAARREESPERDTGEGSTQQETQQPQ